MSKVLVTTAAFAIAAVPVLAAVVSLAGLSKSNADANAPVCAQTYGKSDGLSCNYATYEQCRAFISGLAGSCVDNPHLRAGSNQYQPKTRRGP